MHKAQVPACVLILTGGNAAELLQPKEKIFNEMALLVSPPIAEPWGGFIRLGRNAEIGVTIGDILTQAERSVCLDGQHSGAVDGNTAQEFFRNRDVIHVSSRKLDMNRVPQRVNNRMNLRAATSETYFDTFVLALVLGLAFPFFAAPALALCALI